MPVVVVVVAVADATSLVKCSAEVSSPRLARAGRLFWLLFCCSRPSCSSIMLSPITGRHLHKYRPALLFLFLLLLFWVSFFPLLVLLPPQRTALIAPNWALVTGRCPFCTFHFQSSCCCTANFLPATSATDLADSL